MSILSFNSKVYSFMETLWDVIKLNFLWLLFSAPIITIGASTVAVYSVSLKMVQNREGDVVKQFIKAFKDNFKQGVPLGIITIFLAYIIYINFELFNKIESNPMALLLSGIVLLFIFLLHLTYAYPLLAVYDNSIYRTLKNSAKISMRFFGRTVVLWLIVIFLIVIFLFNKTLLFLGLLIGPVSIFLTISGFAHKIFTMINYNQEN